MVIHDKWQGTPLLPLTQLMLEKGRREKGWERKACGCHSHLAPHASVRCPVNHQPPQEQVRIN